MSATTPAATRFSLRWWHWLLLGVGFLITLLMTVILAVRASGRGDVATVFARLRAEGQPMTLADFIARAPTTDRQAQETWDAWSKRSPDFPDYQNAERESWDRWVSGHGPFPEALAAKVEAQALAFQPGLTVLRQHDLLISTYGWIAADLPPSKQLMPFLDEVRMPNLLGTRAMSEWLRHRAVLADDPRPHLADLERFHHALTRQPGTLIDAMIAVACANIRDRTYLDLALLGKLPAESSARWAAEPGRHLQWIADGLDGERLLFGSGVIVLLEQGPFSFDLDATVGYSLERSWRDLFASPYFWTTGHHDCAITLETEAHLSARLRRERLDPLPPGAEVYKRMWGLGRMFIGNLRECAITGLEADAKHRLMRIATDLVLSHQHGLGLPANHADLVLRLGEPDQVTPAGDHLHLHYELLASERFRLSMAPTSPAPNFDDPGRMPYRSQAVGKPASANPVVVGSSIEIHLPPKSRPPTP